MKTSLNLDEALYLAAKEETLKTGKPLSEIVSVWARLGQNLYFKNAQAKKQTKFKPVHLGGGAHIDINCRRYWLEMLER